MTQGVIAGPGEQAGLDMIAEKSSGAPSRPPKTNCTNRSQRDIGDPWWRRREERVDEFVDRFPERAARPISVRGGTKLREECAVERDSREGTSAYVSKSWSSVLDEFLSWYNDYRTAHLVFRDPDGGRVRAPLENAHQPVYRNRYYARLKALERQVVTEFTDPHTVMLTFTGSTHNVTGGWRCPADHLRDVIETWRPDDGRGVYHSLRYLLSEKKGLEWEYAVVVEPFKSGYGHVHVAVFVDGKVCEKDFHPVIDAHLRHCDIAAPDAHDYHSPDPDDRPISVNRIDPSIDLEDLTAGEREEIDAIANLGTYIGEYLAMNGQAELFDRELDELIFRAAIWATGSQMIRFSRGANRMIDAERDRYSSHPDLPSKSRIDDDDSAMHADELADILGGEWSLEAIGRVDWEGERLCEVKEASVKYVEIEDNSQLDLPQHIAFSRPTVRTEERNLNSY